MSIFPADPDVGDVVTSGSRSWVWTDRDRWESSATALPEYVAVSTVNGVSGAVTITAAGLGALPATNPTATGSLVVQNANPSAAQTITVTSDGLTAYDPGGAGLALSKDGIDFIVDASTAAHIHPVSAGRVAIVDGADESPGTLDVKRVAGLITPTDDADAASKGYVDGQIPTTPAEVGADPVGTAAAAVADPLLTGRVGFRPAGLDDWATALANAPTTAVDVVLIADSLDGGTTASTFAPWSWILGRALARVGGGAPVHQWVPAKATNHPSMDVNAGTVAASAVGGWGATLTNTQVATHTAWCDAVSVVWSAGSGTLTVRDGAGGTVLGTIDTTTGTGAGNVWTSAAITGAVHTIHITSTGTTTFSGVYMHHRNRTTGVRVWGASHNGWASDDFTSDTATAIDLITELAPALVIVATGTNDTTVPDDAEALISAIQAASPTSTVVGWVPPRSDGFTSTESANLRAAFATAGLPVIDVDLLLADYRDALTIDGVHPTATGRAAFAAATATILSGDPLGLLSRGDTVRASAVEVGGILGSEIRAIGSGQAALEGKASAARLEMGTAVVTEASGVVTVAPSVATTGTAFGFRVDTPGEGYVQVREGAAGANQPVIELYGSQVAANPSLSFGTIFTLPFLQFDNAAGTMKSGWFGVATGVLSAGLGGDQQVNMGAALYSERTDPAAPAANKAVLYAKDNGAGKTQLCVRFPTGAVQVIATEP